MKPIRSGHVYERDGHEALELLEQWRSKTQSAKVLAHLVAAPAYGPSHERHYLEKRLATVGNLFGPANRYADMVNAWDGFHVEHANVPIRPAAYGPPTFMMHGVSEQAAEREMLQQWLYGYGRQAARLEAAVKQTAEDLAKWLPTGGSRATWIDYLTSSRDALVEDASVEEGCTRLTALLESLPLSQTGREALLSFYLDSVLYAEAERAAADDLEALLAPVNDEAADPNALDLLTATAQLITSKKVKKPVKKAFPHEYDVRGLALVLRPEFLPHAGTLMVDAAVATGDDDGASSRGLPNLPPVPVRFVAHYVRSGSGFRYIVRQNGQPLTLAPERPLLEQTSGWAYGEALRVRLAGGGLRGAAAARTPAGCRGCRRCSGSGR